MVLTEKILTINRRADMEITILHKQGRVPVTILELAGILDGSNHVQFEEEAKKIRLSGRRDVLIDLSKLTFMSSSGLAAIHKTALLFRDPPKAEEESGRTSTQPIHREHGVRVFKHVELFSPQPRVAEIFYIASFDSLFKIHTNLNAALASF